MSNLLFASKLVEHATASRLNNNMSEHGLHEIFQSAYKKYHSTEMALLRISDALRATNKKKYALLVLLDLSVAFDMVDHSVPLSSSQTRLEHHRDSTLLVQVIPHQQEAISCHPEDIIQMSGSDLWSTSGLCAEAYTCLCLPYHWGIS